MSFARLSKCAKTLPPMPPSSNGWLKSTKLCSYMTRRCARFIRSSARCSNLHPSRQSPRSGFISGKTRRHTASGEDGRARKRGAPALPPPFVGPLCQDFCQDFAVYVGQPALDSVVIIAQALMVDAKQVQDGGVQVVNGCDVLHRLVAEVIGCA